MMGFPPGIFVGSGHALRVHDVFIFYLCWVSTGFFVGAGQGMPCAYMVDLFFIYAFGFPRGYS
jgi:hypothetical protein